VTTGAELTIVAHRGGGGTAPENTLAAFRRTIENGIADAVEFDIQRSSDGELMVFHDADLRRTTNVRSVFPDRAEAPFGDFTAAELGALDCGSWFYSDAFAGEPMPTLAETLEEIGGRVGIHLELKHPHRYPGIEEDLASVLREHRLVGWEGLSVVSFEPDSLRRFHRILPEVRLGAAIRSTAELEEPGIRDIVASVGIVPQYTVAELRIVEEYGLAVSVGTPNSPRRMRETLADGIRTITSDYPEVLSRIARGLEPFDADAPLVIDEVIVDDDEPSVRTAIVRSTRALGPGFDGWYLWNGVATPVALPGGRLPAGATARIPLTTPRAKDVSSIQALALHDPTHRIVDLFEYWAVRRTR
jgi:glycerophosphoryl diester phosphodiesterase